MANTAEHQAHRHDHHHGHGHHHHGHTVTVENGRAVGLAALLTGAFMLAEVAGGLISGSLALLADAAHMVTDFAALALAYTGFHLARRPAGRSASFGLDRFGILAAFVNGLALFLLSGWIVVEAIGRLNEPRAVQSGIMMAVAVGGLFVNLGSFWLLSRADRSNLNIRGALGHVLGDLLGSIAAIVAAGVIMTTGWTTIDPVLSILVALLVLRSAWSVTRDSAHILLEATPADLDAEAIIADLETRIDGLVELHHVHIWALTQERPIATLHAVIAENRDSAQIRSAIRKRLHERHRIGHVTIEIERQGEACDHPADLPAYRSPA